MLSITATDLPRFMACNGSISMKAPVLDVDRDTTVKDEGIAAHWLVEQIHKGLHNPEELVDRQAPNGVYITGEMVEHLEEYIEAVTKSGYRVEYDTSYANQQFSIRGRADAVFVSVNHIKILDLKYGWSIVEPEMNWTMISHAIAVMPPAFNGTIQFRIFQPRPHHPDGRVRSWTISRDDLLKLQSDMIRALTNPSDTLNTSEHCRNCPALAICPAANKAKYNIIEASEHVFADTLSNEELSHQLDQIKRAGAMLKDLEKAYGELAQHRIKQGHVISNYSLETELTNRQWKQNVTPEFVQAITGKDLTKKKLITPAQAEKAGVSKEIVASLVERVNKGVKLVRIDANTKANKLFKGN